MNFLICAIIGHKPEYHLDYIYGSLPREHGVCSRCGFTTLFEKPTIERQAQLPLVDCFESRLT